MPSALGGVFGSSKMLYGAMREMRDGDRQPLLLCGRKEQLDALMEALGGSPGAGPDAAAQLFAVRRLRAEDPRRLARASVAVYGGTRVVPKVEKPSTRLRPRCEVDLVTGGSNWCADSRNAVGDRAGSRWTRRHRRPDVRDVSMR